MELHDLSHNGGRDYRPILNSKHSRKRGVVSIILCLFLLILVGASPGCGEPPIQFYYRVLAASDSFCPPFQGICWSFVLPGTTGAPAGVTAVQSDNFAGSHGTIYLIKIETIWNNSLKTFKFDPRDLYISDPRYNLTWIPENQLANVTHLLTPMEIAGTEDESAERKVNVNGLVLIAAPIKWMWIGESNSNAPKISYKKQPYEPDQNQTFSFYAVGSYADQPRRTEVLHANGDTEGLFNKGPQEKP